MKKMILFIALTSMFAVHANSQVIFNEVNRIMHRAESIKNDKSKDLNDRKIATFKADAIFYLLSKASEDPKFTEYELGKQTNAMVDFVNSFQNRWNNYSNKSDKESLMNRYKTASLQNSLFNDPEKDIVEAYVNNEKFITQFSIDTNWIKAYETVK